MLAHIIVRRFPPSDYGHSKQVTVKADRGLQIAYSKTDMVEVDEAAGGCIHGAYVSFTNLKTGGLCLSMKALGSLRRSSSSPRRRFVALRKDKKPMDVRREG